MKRFGIFAALLAVLLLAGCGTKAAEPQRRFPLTAKDAAQAVADAGFSFTQTDSADAQICSFTDPAYNGAKALDIYSYEQYNTPFLSMISQGNGMEDSTFRWEDWQKQTELAAALMELEPGVLYDALTALPAPENRALSPDMLELFRWDTTLADGTYCLAFYAHGEDTPPCLTLTLCGSKNGYDSFFHSFGAGWDSEEGYRVYTGMDEYTADMYGRPDGSALLPQEGLTAIDVQLGKADESGFYTFRIEDSDTVAAMAKLLEYPRRLGESVKTYYLDAQLTFRYSGGSTMTVEADLRGNLCHYDGMFYTFSLQENGESLTEETWAAMAEWMSFDQWPEEIQQYWLACGIFGWDVE